MRVWPGDDLGDVIAEATHILASAAPDDDGDPVLPTLGASIAAASVRWVGYLSTTGVYGDHGGDWVNETATLAPATERGQRRVAAEAAWQALGVPLHIFRLAGIYGPGRGPFEKVRSGRARRIVKPGQVFSRIHVDDIAQVLAASIAAPNPGAYNVADDEPAPPQDVIAFAARLLHLPAPPEVPFGEAELSPMARSFYAEFEACEERPHQGRAWRDAPLPDLSRGTARDPCRREASPSAMTMARGGSELDAPVPPHVGTQTGGRLLARFAWLPEILCVRRRHGYRPARGRYRHPQQAAGAIAARAAANRVDPVPNPWSGAGGDGAGNMAATGQ